MLKDVKRSKNLQKFSDAPFLFPGAGVRGPDRGRGWLRCAVHDPPPTMRYHTIPPAMPCGAARGFVVRRGGGTFNRYHSW